MLDQPGGQGVSGVRITVQTGLGYGLSAITGMGGIYSLDVEVQRAPYTTSLWITNGYVGPGESTAQQVDVDVAGKDATAPTLFLMLPQSISGTVRHADSGEPLPFGLIDGPLGTCKADENGKYLIHVPPGEHSISCSGTAGGAYYSVTKRRDVQVGSGKSVDAIDFKVRRCPSVSGRVDLPDGSPAKGAELLIRYDWKHTGPDRISSLSDLAVPVISPSLAADDGRFEAILPVPQYSPAKLKADSYELQIVVRSADGSFSGTGRTKLAKAGTSPDAITIKLAENGTARVQLTRANRQPIRTGVQIVGGFSVAATGPSDAFELHRVTALSQRHIGRGNYRIGGLIPGVRYELRFLAGGKFAEAAGFDAVAGREIPLGILVADSWRDGSPAQLARQLSDRTQRQSDRRRAAQTLGEYGVDAAAFVPLLIKALNTDSDIAVRAAAARALGTIGNYGRSAVPDLIEALQNGHCQTRSAAAFALSKIGDDSALSVLLDAQDDPSPDVRRWAREGIERIEKTKPD